MPSVLVVDDSEVDRRLVTGLLAKSGRYEVQIAENGSQALAALRTSHPAVLLTDLHMPGRGGLSLIEACRMHHANIPVVLMTGMGSENLAVEALKAGAAGYVPKSLLAERLVETIDDVLRHAEQDESARRLVGQMTRSEFRFELENNPDLAPPLVDMAEQLLAGLEICNRVDCMRVGSALKAVVSAVMLQGNLELSPEAADDDGVAARSQAVARRAGQSPYRDRRVQVDLRFQPLEARFTVKHQGPPLWTNDHLKAVSDEGLSDPTLRPIALMQAFCDEVRLGPEGEVTLVVRKK
jgi:CheY-like chemotaxis protein